MHFTTFATLILVNAAFVAVREVHKIELETLILVIFELIALRVEQDNEFETLILEHEIAFEAVKRVHKMPVAVIDFDVIKPVAITLIL